MPGYPPHRYASTDTIQLDYTLTDDTRDAKLGYSEMIRRYGSTTRNFNFGFSHVYDGSRPQQHTFAHQYGGRRGDRRDGERWREDRWVGGDDGRWSAARGPSSDREYGYGSSSRDFSSQPYGGGYGSNSRNFSSQSYGGDVPTERPARDHYEQSQASAGYSSAGRTPTIEEASRQGEGNWYGSTFRYHPQGWWAEHELMRTQPGTPSVPPPPPADNFLVPPPPPADNYLVPPPPPADDLPVPPAYTSYTSLLARKGGIASAPPASQLPSIGPSTYKQRHQAPKQFLLLVPQPTPQYMELSNVPPKAMATSRSLLVVLDMNGTLLYRRGLGSTAFTKRPKVDAFLEYLFANHTVMVWSSATDLNVATMCQKLFTPAQRTQLVAAWGRSTLRIPAHLKGKHIQVYKRLSWVWGDRDIQATQKEQNDYWDQTNTVLIDDSIDKAASEPYNVVALEEFEGRPDQMQSDVLGNVVAYLELLKMQGNVSAYMRASPFT